MTTPQSYYFLGKTTPLSGFRLPVSKVNCMNCSKVYSKKNMTVGLKHLRCVLSQKLSHRYLKIQKKKKKMQNFTKKLTNLTRKNIYMYIQQ